MSNGNYPCLAPKKPPVVLMPSQNFGIPKGNPGRGGQPILAIVVHCVKNTMVGYDGLACSNLKLSKSLPDHPSLHYLIGKTGVIHQYVDDLDISWGFPEQTSDPTPVLSGFNWIHTTNNPTLSPDRYVINIGLEVGVNYQDACAPCDGCFSPLPEYAEKKLTQLIAFLADTYNLVLNTSNIVFHQDIDVAADSECSCADRQKLLACVQDYCECCENPELPSFQLGQVQWIYGINSFGCTVREPLADALIRLGLNPVVIDCSGFAFILNGFQTVGLPTTANVTGLVLPVGDAVATYNYRAFSLSGATGLLLDAGTGPTFSSVVAGIRSISLTITTVRGCILSRIFNF